MNANAFQRGHRFATERVSRPCARGGSVEASPVAPRSGLRRPSRSIRNGMRIGLLGGSFNPPHRRASRHQPVRDQAAEPRPGVVAGDAGQSAQGSRRLARSRRARRGRAPNGQRSAHRRQLSRSCHRNAIYRRHDYISAPPHLRPAPGLDHGRRQSRAISSLAKLAAHRLRGADRGDRPSAAKFSRAWPRRRPRRSRAIACPRIRPARLADQHAPAWVFLTGMKLNLSSTGLRNPDGSWRTEVTRSGFTGMLKQLTPHA